VTCRGSRVAVVLNGEPVVDMDLDRWTEPLKNPDGSKNKFPRAMKDFARSGYIGLQDHGRPVWYRGLRIRRL
ncbi:MAG TPA: family 16 glycoside hydrolase, partial [Planctomycetota bacterium]|nr:family 16 glycoside hydrolase [Planctomycetota bacterium]